ncbi:MAG: purine-binding chemotaxis protein CheW [Armatimonadetes bacterium]|nr:purine-binding chemotaxis protein CheW [Armatimonadota bacterium]
MEGTWASVDNLLANRQTVVFRLGASSFGIDIFRVSEIVRPSPLTPVPGAGPSMKGLMDIHGKTVPVVDLRRRMDLPEEPDSPGSRIIVADTAGGSIGFLVDEVTEIVSGPSAEGLTYIDVDKTLAA